MKAHPALTDEHEALRDTMRRFVAREIAPHAAAWDEAEEFPRELYRKAAAAGLLGIGFPEEYGGTPADLFTHVILAEEIALGGAGGVHAGLFSHQIGSPPVATAGSAELKARVLPPVLAGEKISALAITEPGGGSDVANLRTTARLDGGDYVVNGEKTFITSGMRADVYTVAVRTGGPGASGVSLLLIERDREGFTRSALKKMGWWCSDTATLHFDNVRVPGANLIGEENAGFRIHHAQLQRRAARHGGRSRRLRAGVSRRNSRLGATAQDLRQAPDRASGGAPQAHRDVDPHSCGARARLRHLLEARRCATRQDVRRAARDDQKSRRAGDAVLLRRSRADSRRRRLHPRHAFGAHLSRGESLHDRRRRGGDHEGPRGTATWMVSMQSTETMEAKIRRMFEHSVAFNQVLGLKVHSVDPAGPQLRFDMRPELIGNPRRQILHGGVISAVLDVAAGFAIHLAVAGSKGEASESHFPSIGTIDLRVDYLRPGRGNYFIATGRVVRLGNRVAVAHMDLVNDSGELIATGGAAYMVG
jgi:uncharacterized protein (TIGR00369 family)